MSWNFSSKDEIHTNKVFCWYVGISNTAIVKMWLCYFFTAFWIWSACSIWSQRCLMGSFTYFNYWNELTNVILITALFFFLSSYQILRYTVFFLNIFRNYIYRMFSIIYITYNALLVLLNFMSLECCFFFSLIWTWSLSQSLHSIF